VSDQAIEFLLPGRWSFVPLAQPEATKKVIARLAEDAIGRADEHAQLRAEVRARFTLITDRARDGGGQQLWLGDELAPGVPFPATITAYWPALSIRPPDDPEDEGAVTAAIRHLVGPTDADADEAELTIGGRPALRRAAVSRGPVTADPDAQEVETVEVDYWVVRPDGRRMLVIGCSCGMPMLRERLVELFDVIVTTLRWSEPAAPV
jgi:Arc/MetJ family transcription regulator